MTIPETIAALSDQAEHAAAIQAVLVLSVAFEAAVYPVTPRGTTVNSATAALALVMGRWLRQIPEEDHAEAIAVLMNGVFLAAKGG